MNMSQIARMQGCRDAGMQECRKPELPFLQVLEFWHSVLDSCTLKAISAGFFRRIPAHSGSQFLV
jgi:hypothetical protein